MRNAARVDRNQREIVDALRKAGRSVWDTHQLGKGFPDLVVANVYGRNILLEVKVPGEGLTPKEQEFFASWQGEKYICESAEQALRFTE